MTLIQFRRDAAANWTSSNTLLASGEFGFESDTRKFKIGPGNWNSLDYIDAPTVLAQIAHETIDADLDAREIGFVDVGDGEGYFTLGGVQLSGNLVPPAATWSGVAGRPFIYFNDVKDFGAVGDGVTDDTDAIEAAFTACSGNIFFSPGNYLYNGDGMAAGNIRVIGAGQEFTTITLGPGSYLVDQPGPISRLTMGDFTILGGKGAFRQTYTGTNVIYDFHVQNIRFKDYTECAIASDTSDMPYWRIQKCIFDAADAEDTIGIALMGFQDGVVIEACSFRRNRVDIKLGRGGNNCWISKCELIPWGADNGGGPRISVWVLPEATSTAPGPGLVIDKCKFGNENLFAGDYRVVYADKGSGLAGTAMPVLDADSTGYIAGHRITNCNFINNGNFTAPPIVYSTTPNVQGISINDNYMYGAACPYFLEFRTALTLSDRYNSLSVFGPLTTFQGADGKRTKVSNSDGVGYLVDPAGMFQDVDSTRPASGSSSSFSALSPVAIGSYTLVNCTKSLVADAYGGADAATYSFTTSAGCFIVGLGSAPKVGVPLWIELDVKNPNDGNALSQLYVYTQANSGGYIPWRRSVEVPSVADGWVTYAFQYVPRSTGAIHIRIGNADSGLLKTVTVGRVRAYQSNERQIGGARPTVSGQSGLVAALNTMGVISLSSAHPVLTSAVINFGTVEPGSFQDITMTVTGAAVGDPLALGVPTEAITDSIVYTAWVSATNTVTVRAHNYGGVTSANIASGTYKVSIVR